MNTHNRFFLILCVFLFISQVGCSKSFLVPLSKVQASAAGYASVDAHFCTSAAVPGQQNLKYLFILDHSASNQPGFPNPLTPDDVNNTDPQGSRRYGPLVNFIQNLTPDANTSTSFALIDFNDTAKQSGTTAGFEPSIPSFITNLKKDWIGGGSAASPAPNDSGFTNYQAALQLALQTITKDVKDESVNPNQNGATTSYVIIFVSDGVPTIAVPTAPGGVYQQTYNADIGPLVTSLMNLKNDPSMGPLISNITLNTAYYSNGTDVLAAEQLLGQMASSGNGQYLRFDSGQNILYEQFAPPSRKIINNLVDVFVTNQNLVWWDDGRLLVDSDGDGLPDVIENQIGSNPELADSDGNGVSDLVEYRTKGKACNDPACAPAGRDRYAMCAGFSPSTAPNGTVTFKSTTNDGLNDCEKFVLGASRTQFNSNGDMLPDQFALRAGLPLIAGTSVTAFSDPFNDGMNNYSKVKAGLPIQVSLKNIGTFSGQVSTLTPETSTVDGVSCYHYQASNIATTNTVNNLKIMVVQNRSALENKPFLMSASASLPSRATVLSFQPGDIK
jgi:hypothetical protein